jgi:hypothetical protein
MFLINLTARLIKNGGTNPLKNAGLNTKSTSLAPQSVD